MKQILGSLALGFGMFTSVGIAASPSMLFEYGYEGSSGSEQLGLTVKLSGLATSGLVGLHFDLDYDTSRLQLASAIAGNFFDLNSPTAANWTDLWTFDLAAGDAISTATTNATKQPDVLGVDFLEIAGVPAFTDGVLMHFLFDVSGIEPFIFSANDQLLVDAVGSIFEPADISFTLAGLVNTVPEPSSALLVAAAMVACSSRRKPAGLPEALRVD